MLCGAAFKNKGVQPMLDAVVDYLPSPLDVPPTTGKDLKGERDLERRADDKEPFAALAFKIMADQHLGKLVFARIYSGMIAQGDAVLNSTPRPQGAHRPHRPDACQPPRAARRGLRRATSSPWSG